MSRRFAPIVPVLAIAAALLLTATAPASAVPIVGQADINGYLFLNGPFATATAITSFDIIPPPFLAPPRLVGQSGEFALAGGEPVTFATPVPFVSGPIPSLYSFVLGLNTYRFDLIGLSVDSHTAKTLGLIGTGLLYRNGLDPTPYNFSLTTQTAGAFPGGEYNFSSSTFDVQSVPEPGSLILLGSGISALALRRRRKA